MSLFTTARPHLRVKQIADLVGYPMPTVFRLVATLEEEGYLERTPDGGVRPGIGALSLGFAALQGLDLVQIAEPPLRQLAEETGETVNLGVLSADQVLIVARAQTRLTSLAANIRSGSRVPAVYSSIGKVLLAYLPEADFSSRITAESFSAEWGPKAVRSMPALRRQLADVPRNGYLVQEEEAIPGLSSLAAPIRELGGGVIAALNLAVPSNQYDRARLISEHLDTVLETARTISRRLGG